MGLIDFFKEKLNKIFNKTKLLPEAKEPIEEINFEKEIINKINPSWSEIEKARFIQVKLCQYVNFDPELNLYEIVDKEYQEIYNREFDIEHITKTEITCKSWGRIYQELLNRVGITDVIVNTKQHHAIVIAKLDGKEFRIDPTKDNVMENNQDLFKLKKKIMPMESEKYYNYDSFIPLKLLGEKPITNPRIFYKGTEEEKELQDFFRELKKIDEKIGYLKNGQDYTNVYISMLKREMDAININTIKSKNKEIVSAREILELDENATREDIFRAKFNFILKTINLKNLGFHESIQYLRYMFEALLDEKDLYYEEYSEKLKRNTHHSRIGGCNIYTKAKKGLDFENIFWVKTGKDEYEYYILDLKNREEPIQKTNENALKDMIEPKGKYKLYSDDKTIPHVKEKEDEETPNFYDGNR